MSSTLPSHIFSSTIATALIFTSPLHADWRTDIGYDRLVQIAGSELPDTPTEGLSQIEALNSGGNYAPNQTLAQFSNRTFIEQSGTTGVSSHATTVARNYYGSTNGILTGNTTIDLYSASPWLNSGFLNATSILEPLVETRAVQNHSWIGNLADDSTTEDVIRRLDYAINRDGFSCVVGVNNGSTSSLPDLLAHNYHGISVGLSSGNHSSGTTTADGIGRTKPDIVAPSTATSFATPMVAASAALLHTVLSNSPYSLSGAERVRTIKALLMASARKDTVQESGTFSWSNSTTSPLDSNSGAGELNIFLAYKILRSGPVTSSATTIHGTHGWASEEVTSSSTKQYFFTIPAGTVSPPVSALITWHRVIEDGTPSPNSWANPTSSFADLNLKLHQANGTTLGSEISSSNSSADNVELIHQSSLPPGDYAWVVESSSSTSTPYTLAWQTIPVVTVAATDNTASEIDATNGEFTVTRNDDTTLPLLVSLSFSGTAVEDLDYSSISTNVTIPAGQSSVVIPVTPISDDNAQGDRTLTVQLASDFTYSNSSQTAEITIEDKPFDKWRAANFDFEQLADPTISSLDSDPDGDSFVNLIEYALDQDPLALSTISLVSIESNGRLTLTATKNSDATDITWSAEDSGDLEIWNPAEIIINSATLFQARDISTNPGEDKRFIRLQITRP